MSVFLRGSTYYVKVRVHGRQVLRSLNTSDFRKAKLAAETLVPLLRNGAIPQPDTTLIPLAAHNGAPERPDTLGTFYEAFRQATEHRVDRGHVRPSYLLDIRHAWATRLQRHSHRIVDAQLVTTVIEHLDRLPGSVDRRRKAYTLFRRLAGLAGLKTEPHRFQSALPPREKRPLTSQQLEACKQTCLSHPHPSATRIYLAAVTGARIGETMALGPSDVGPDFIRISKTRCRRTGAIVAAKTKNSNRTIPVAPEALDVVRSALAVEPHYNWLPTWLCIRKRAGLGKVGVHILRHTWATNALAAGITPKAVSLALGHASVTFTEWQYARFLTIGHFKTELVGFNR